jgi:hypothetical protein
MQDDLAAILRELGLGDHARPLSPHQVVQTEVLPMIRAWRMALTASGVPVPTGCVETPCVDCGAPITTYPPEDGAWRFRCGRCARSPLAEAQR